MSLYKQLWLSIAFLMSLAFLGSFIVSSISAKAYLEEQLYRKNVDNASSIALSLTSHVSDDLMVELFINSQFDTGHYQFIHIVNMAGETLAEQIDRSDYREAPRWLMSLFPIKVKPGVAQISNGWTQVGTLTLSSHAQFAYRQLWENAKRLGFYFILMSAVSGLIGSVLLRVITSPLNKAVDHAQAIGERRFITTAEPKTLEFKAVIRSMNKLSQHVKQMLEDESSKLEKWRKGMQHDKITNLLNREPVLNQLASYLRMENEDAGGAIVLIRVFDLFELNQQYGRQEIDGVLKRIGEFFSSIVREEHLAIAGRLNGSDFLIVLPERLQDIETFSRHIHENLQRILREMNIENGEVFAASTTYLSGESIGDVLTVLDSGIALSSEAENESYTHIPHEQHASKNSELDWQQVFDDAIKQSLFSLEFFGVYTTEGELLHWEAPLRLRIDNDTLSAGAFMPHFSRLEMGPAVDKIAIQLALQQIKQHNKAVGINLSSSLLTKPTVMAELSEMIKHENNGNCLWVELPEHGVFQNLDGFRTFCQLLKPMGCKIGIEHIGHEALHLGELHDLGLDYVKIDRAIIHNIDNNTSSQLFLRGLCTIVHSIGLKAIAEGVEKNEEWQTLIELGIDGGTGAFFKGINE